MPLVTGSIKLYDARLERFLVFPLGEKPVAWHSGLDVVSDNLWAAFAPEANEKVVQVYKVTFLLLLEYIFIPKTDF